MGPLGGNTHSWVSAFDFALALLQVGFEQASISMGGKHTSKDAKHHRF